MLAFTIILSWCFIVALACCLGANQDLERSQITVSLTTARLNGQIKENRRAHEKTKALLSYVDTDREYRAFDDVLKRLPLQSTGYPRQFELISLNQLDHAAYNFNSEPCCDSVAITKLAFNAEQLDFNGREATAWLRTGWLLIPESAMSRKTRG